MKEAYYDHQSDRFVQRLFYLNEQSKYVAGSYCFEMIKSMKNNDYRVSYISQINQEGDFEGYGVKVINGSEITYGILKGRNFIEVLQEWELPLGFWDFQNIMTQYNKSFITFTNEVRVFLTEANDNLSISINYENWDFFSDDDLISLQKKFKNQIKELDDFKK